MVLKKKTVLEAIFNILLFKSGIIVIVVRYLDPIAQRCINKTVYYELRRFFGIEIGLLYCFFWLYLQHLPLKQKTNTLSIITSTLSFSALAELIYVYRYKSICSFIKLYYIMLYIYIYIYDINIGILFLFI